MEVEIVDRIEIEVDSQLDQNVVVELTVGCPKIGKLVYAGDMWLKWKLVVNGLGI